MPSNGERGRKRARAGTRWQVGGFRLGGNIPFEPNSNENKITSDFSPLSQREIENGMKYNTVGTIERRARPRGHCPKVLFRVVTPLPIIVQGAQSRQKHVAKTS